MPRGAFHSHRKNLCQRLTATAFAAEPKYQRSESREAHVFAPTNVDARTELKGAGRERRNTAGCATGGFSDRRQPKPQDRLLPSKLPLCAGRTEAIGNHRAPISETRQPGICDLIRRIVEDPLGKHFDRYTDIGWLFSLHRWVLEGAIHCLKWRFGLRFFANSHFSRRPT